MTELPARDLRAISMAAFLDASPTEIAEALELTPGAARVVLHRARKRLYGALKFVVLVRRRSAACTAFVALAAADDLLAAGRHLASCEVCQRAGSAEIKLYGDRPTPVPRSTQAELLVRHDGGSPTSMRFRRRLVVGRECLGVPVVERLLVDDSTVSRQHVELREDEAGNVFVVDTSSNGTLLNGVHMERGAIVPFRPGDRVKVGPIELELSFVPAEPALPDRPTTRVIAQEEMVLVAGEIAGYGDLVAGNDRRSVVLAIEAVFRELHALVRLYGGGLANVTPAGFLALWRTDEFPDALDRALDFTTLAGATAARLAPRLVLEPAGRWLRMGWAVAVGDASVGLLAGAITTVVSDAANVALALASIAALDEGAEPLVAAPSLDLERFEFAAERDVVVEGRADPVTVRPYLSRRPGSPPSSG
jgi:hypothetical protein